MKEKDRNNISHNPQYGMGSNILYMLRHGAIVPGVLWLLALEIALGVAVSVTTLYMAPSFLRLLEDHGSIRELLFTIAAFSAAMICLSGLDAYVKAIQCTGRLQVRIGIIREINRKLGTCSYSLLFSPGFQDKRKNARTATGNNLSATERFWDTLYDILKNSICFLIYLSLMVQVKPILAVTATAITALGFVWTRRFDRWGYDHREEEGAARRKIDYLYECAKSVRLAKEIRIFGMKDWIRDMEEDVSRIYRDLQTRRERNGLLGDGIGIGLDFLRNGISYAYLLTVTLQGNLSAAEFLLYFTAATGFTGQVKGILSGLGELYRHSLDLSGVRELCEIPEPFLLEGGYELTEEGTKACSFEFKNVTFRYPNAEKPILEHFNLRIEAGEKLAVVGLNGAGKTTLVKLLCGLFDPDSGEILLNGRNIGTYNRQEYYKLFGAVFQDFQLLAVALGQNVAAGSLVDAGRARECLKKAGLSEWLEKQRSGLDTRLYKKV